MSGYDRQWVPLRPEMIAAGYAPPHFKSYRLNLSAHGPLVDDGLLPPLEVDPSEWQRLEQCLRRQLDNDQRSDWRATVRSFLFAVCLKPELPTPRQYRTDLGKRLRDIRKTADNLFAQLYAAGPVPSDGPTVEAKDAEERVGEGMAALKSAISASATTSNTSPVLSIEDHVRAQLLRTNSKMASELTELDESIHTALSGIADLPTNQAGADGHYELTGLFEDLLLIARVAGDDLSITSHEFRSRGGADKITPAVAFVHETMRIVQSGGDSLIEQSPIRTDYKDQAKSLLNKLLDKDQGSLLEPLEDARSRIEGGYRKDRPKKSTD
jgi:hypothetical protein